MQHVSFSNFYNKHKINLTRTFQLLFLLQKLIEISSFVFFTNRRNLCLWSSGKLVIIAKVFLKLPNLLMLIRPKSVTSQKLGSLVTFGKSLIVISTKVNLPYLYLVVLACYLPHLVRLRCLLKSFLRTPILMIQVFLFGSFPSRTNLKLDNIPVTLKLVKRVIADFDFSKVCGQDCISVVVWKNWEPELSYVIAKIFNVSEGLLYSRFLKSLMCSSCI